MKHVYILVTDGQSGLFLQEQQTRRVSLINHTIWPIIKPMTSVHWPVALVKHATYGLFDISGRYEWSPRPFGLPSGTSFVVARVSTDELKRMVQDSERIYTWHRYNAKFVCPWKLKLIALDLSLDQMDLMTAHCIKAFHEVSSTDTTHGPNFDGPTS
jgi:hypothetical protein